MLSFDWSNVFFILVILAFLIFALRTDNKGLMIGSHIIVFVTLLSFVTPLFAMLYGVFAGYHITGASE